ncbi:MAG: hypothetical protein IJM17_02200 [Firmicutes bacterium]|nr:hypothetical protein [Bacillota bacterium]
MKYVNGFNINVTGNECFVTFVQNIPKGEAKVTEEVENIIMSERTARQLIAALSQVYAKVDADRRAMKDGNHENPVKVS